jgi:hypothetical protein
MLRCHERDDTTQKSVGKAKFTSAEGCTPEGKSAGVLSEDMLSLSCPWIGQVWGSQSMQLAN